MSAGTATSGGIRNLLAMFENKQIESPTSPSKRDQVPYHHDIPSNNRPLNKVRTQFVAVGEQATPEKPLTNGFAKSADTKSSPDLKENLQDTTSSRDELAKAETPAMSPLDTSKQSIDGGLGSILKGSAFEAGAGNMSEDTTTKPNQISQSPTDDKKVAGGSQLGRSAKTIASTQRVERNNIKPQSQPQAAAKNIVSGPTVKTQVNNTGAPQTTSTSPTVSKINAKSPISLEGSAIQHIKGGPAKIRGVIDSANRAREARESIAQKADADSKKEPLSKPNKVNGIKNDQPSSSNSTMPNSTKQQISSSSVGKLKPAVAKKDTANSPSITTKPTTIKKDINTSSSSATAPADKPKSPAKAPGRLPSAATAPTAASVARTEAHASPQTQKTIFKKPSAPALRSKPPAAAGTTSSISKKSSRASLKPIAVSNTQSERPSSRVSVGQSGESFLARMTRPTASSSQKTHDKLQVASPPRSRNVSGSHNNIRPSAAGVSAPVVMKPQFPPKPAHDGDYQPEDDENKQSHGVEEDVSDGKTESNLDVVKEDPIKETPSTPSTPATTNTASVSASSATTKVSGADETPNVSEKEQTISPLQPAEVADENRYGSRIEPISEMPVTPSKTMPSKENAPTKRGIPTKSISPPKTTTPAKGTSTAKETTPEKAISTSPAV